MKNNKNISISLLILATVVMLSIQSCSKPSNQSDGNNQLIGKSDDTSLTVPGLSAVSNSQGTATFNLEIYGGDNVNEVLENSGKAIGQFGANLAKKSDLAPNTKYVKFKINGPFKDNLGNVVSIPYFDITYKVEKLAAANYANLTGYEVLNFSERVVADKTFDQILDFCQGNRGNLQTATFCNNYYNNFR
ncbi:MAG: hypothetical protein J0L55_13550 [Caulobacterales bacterium]|nr:hypothetical protein [Caulobacterales bacterium]MCA0372216.1 hypothetical protein [Pseudomonadota bacterium]